MAWNTGRVNLYMREQCIGRWENELISLNIIFLNHRFFCTWPGSRLEGRRTVFCDGEAWNSTRPLCLVPPSPPSLTVMVNNILVEKTSVAFGENITLYCNTSHGVPPPTFALYIHGERVEEVDNATASYSFTVTQLHDRAKINCSAENEILPFPVFSQSHVLTIRRK